MTTLTDITQASATLTASGSLGFSARGRATLKSSATLTATPSIIRSGIAYREANLTLSGSGSLSATPRVRKPASAILGSSSGLRLGSGSKGAFPALTGQAGNMPYASAVGVLPALISSSHDPLAQPAYGISSASFEPLFGLAYMLTGTIGESMGNLAPMTGMASDRPYAASGAQLPALVGLSNSGDGPLEATTYGFMAVFDVMLAEQSITGKLLESLTIGDAATAGRQIDRTMLEALTIESAFTASGQFNARIAETLRMLSGFLRQDASIAWVVNANAATSKGTRTYPNSMYDGYDFNSLGKFKGRYFGARADGIYELKGDTDNGQAIVSQVLLNKDNYGAAQLKNVRYVYASVKAKGDLEVTVKTDDDSEYAYRMPTSDQLSNARAQTGRGLRATHWQLMFANPDGGDFTIESAEVFAEKLTRRM